MRIIDRYVIRQVLMPLAIGLVVFTFIFIIEALREYVEPLVAKGVPPRVLITVLGTLIPQALALSIPMALLLGLLVAFGRLSSDREFVAMQACGVSLRRLLLPVALLSLLGWAATSYVMLVAVPASNQTFREVTFSVIAQRAEGEVKPRVFFTDFPDLMLYVREVPLSGDGWNGVFMSDTRPGEIEAIYLAEHGRVVIDRKARTVQLLLERGERHTVDADGYQVFRFGEQIIRVDPDKVFPSGGPLKGDQEMTIAELRARIAEHEAEHISTHNQWMAIHQKFSIPVACLVFGVIGLALGATNHRGGALASFGFGLTIVFAYYVAMYFFRQLPKGNYLPPWLAVWLPNILFGLLAVGLFVWRSRLADQPLRIPMPTTIRRIFAATFGAALTARHGNRGLGRLLDRYIASTFGRTLLLSLGAAMAVFYISTFIDLSDKVFKGMAPGSAILEYFWYASPQFAYYTLPMAVLIAALVTVGALTRNSELIVMRACGVSLYRTSVPILMFAVVVGGLLFSLDSSILGPANRRAEALRDQMRGVPRIEPFNEPWVLGDDGAIYNVRGYDSRIQTFVQVNVYEFDGKTTNLTSRTYAERWRRAPGPADSAPVTSVLENGWRRDFGPAGRKYEPFASSPRSIDPVGTFSREAPDAKYMSYQELRHYGDRLQRAGFDTVEYEVGSARKLAYPFVCVIMTLIAIPFATTMGRSGTMAGIAVGVALALGYWGTINISAAMGVGGLLAPLLAAWAPNLLFGAGAAYLLLTVRT